MSKRILVTGGAGYVGAHCCKAFAAEGWEVSVFDNLARGNGDFVRWGPLIKGDVRDREALAAALARVQPHAVAHMAALTSAQESRSDPGRFYDTNAMGTLNLLHAMRVAGVPCLVFSSSGAVYGDTAGSLIPEGGPLCPVNAYGWSIYQAERMIADFCASHSLRSVVLRYFHVAGADPDDGLGDRRRPGRHLIARAISATDPASSYPVTISGFDHATPDGTAIRDFIHVTDVASAHAAALAYLMGGADSQVLNLGSGQGHSARESIDAVDRAAGQQVRYAIAPQPKSDPPILVADPARARAILSWRTRFSDLDQMIGDELLWREANARRAMRPRS
jgi:UDP-glucose-4-epimerase GalE